MRKDPLIEIFSGTLWQAELVKTLLANGEINSFIKNSVLNTYAYEPTFSAEVKVMILSSDSVKAKVIVDEYLKSIT